MDSIDRELERVSRWNENEGERTYAQTWVPVSGIMVKRTLLSSRRTQATFPREESDAVSSRIFC